jgi:hypothetical protein
MMVMIDTASEFYDVLSKVYVKSHVKWFYQEVILSQMKNKRKHKDDNGRVWDFLAGLAMGFIGYNILSEIANRKPKCHICMSELKRGQPLCHVYKNQLRWNYQRFVDSWHCGYYTEWLTYMSNTCMTNN